MAKIKMGQLFYKEGIEKLEVEAEKNGKRPTSKEHVDFLREQAKKRLKYKKPSFITGMMQEFNYLIFLFQENGIPFLLEINTEKPKQHILYVPADFEKIDKNQADILYDKTKSFKRFIKSGNKLGIISYKDSEDFKNMEYNEYTIDDLIGKVIKVKYGSAFNIEGTNKTR